ncbi:uncharacterized protein CHD9NB isoform X1 [Artibeus jamaicensis]|uniref:uncharacterized protein CHD9NB isoform X1 n=1 Tax=Artibeus jamaicensis TaxID=9417 RepID=UPI00235AF025|nr:uncharacterized protein CHD9NB isoform X1 [Artibeus jamaicensis]
MFMWSDLVFALPLGPACRLRSPGPGPQQHVWPLRLFWLPRPNARWARRPPRCPPQPSSRETPGAQGSYLGCRRCPPVPGIPRLRFDVSLGSAGCRLSLRREVPAGAQRHLVAAGRPCGDWGQERERKRERKRRRETSMLKRVLLTTTTSCLSIRGW